MTSESVSNDCRDTLPEVLMNKVEAYIPADPVALLGDLQVFNKLYSLVCACRSLQTVDPVP